jgi:GntR family transcriptional regulator/MocR family aminotransferase
MVSLLLPIEGDNELGLRDQLRQRLVAAILDGAFSAEERLPSSRQLSKQLRISRNTVTAAYRQLVDEGYLVSRERSGLYVNKDFLRNSATSAGDRLPTVAPTRLDDSVTRLATASEGLKGFRYPSDWQSYPYPFIDGRFDRSLFPVSEWREANKLSLSVNDVNQWSTDSGDGDDPQLIEQIRSKVLPLRGIRAGADEILITMGVEQALHILAEVLIGPSSVCGVEEPGSPEMRYLASRRGARIKRLPIDECGVVLGSNLDECDMVHVTPSHQRPTGAVLSLERRRDLLARAASNGTIILEEDFEFDITGGDHILPALKSMDKTGRVIYVGSVSKSLSPSLRLGYIVAPRDLIAELRELRHAMVRHPSAFLQHAFALFLSLGHHDAHARKVNQAMQERMAHVAQALRQYLPDFQFQLPYMCNSLCNSYTNTISF